MAEVRPRGYDMKNPGEAFAFHMDSEGFPAVFLNTDTLDVTILNPDKTPLVTMGFETAEYFAAAFKEVVRRDNEIRKH